MNKSLWRSLLASPVVFATILACSPWFPAAANPKTSNTMAQVTSVSQLSDVQPTDWAFQALQSLVERYGCIAGYPDGTYRGNRALTRYEFAAGLNACLDRVNELIATATTDLVTKEDLATLQKLQEEFGTELATLRGRVDSLEAATAELEANQFSTTTKLSGIVVAAVSDVFGGDNAETGEEVEDNTIFTDRARLEFSTSFTGKDLLYTLISAGNFRGYAGITGTAEGDLAFTRAQDEEEPDNDVGLETLEYTFPLGESTEVTLAAAGAAFYDFTDTVTLFDGDGDSGALSLYGTRNPIYNLGDGAGLGIKHQLGDLFEISLGYLAAEGNDPADSSGLFNGPYAAIGQVLFKPSDRLKLGLTYVHSYRADDTGTGSRNATFNQFDADYFASRQIIGQGDDAPDVPTSSNAYGVQLSWQLSDGIVVGSWAGYTRTTLLSTVNGAFDRGGLEIWNYAVTLGFPDFGKEGSLLGFVFGMEPKVEDSTVAEVAEDEDTSFHIEGFYQYQLTDNIAITPGVIWITAPGFNNDNDDAIIGALRTTFSF
ncbi:hypothetical protein C7B80_12460 [Cyanosarcina cf. burmensis CCALA 770]|nr:hypothetical protein C7B80_12460 [Cyanosarcina cf. burmensis CCALA 770]